MSSTQDVRGESTERSSGTRRCTEDVSPIALGGFDYLGEESFDVRLQQRFLSQSAPAAGAPRGVVPRRGVRRGVVAGQGVLSCRRKPANSPKGALCARFRSRHRTVRPAVKRARHEVPDDHLAGVTARCGCATAGHDRASTPAAHSASRASQARRRRVFSTSSSAMRRSAVSLSATR